jgi:hypothetical protein
MRRRKFNRPTIAVSPRTASSGREGPDLRSAFVHEGQGIDIS